MARASPSLPSYRDRPPKLVAGARCLDFLNTVEWRGDPRARGERLGSYAEFIAWGEAAGYVTPGEERRLRSRAEREPRRAKTVVRDAILLREALARFLDPHAGPGGRGLAALNTLLSTFPFAFRLVWEDGAVRRVPAEARDALRQPLERIVLEAIELVTSGRLRAVSHCGNDRCGWFFLDESRNRSRRWCDMAACGNNAKVRSHRARRRAASH